MQRLPKPAILASLLLNLASIPLQCQCDSSHVYLSSSYPLQQIMTVDTGWAEKRLVKSLLEDYDRRSRPVVDDVTPQKRLSTDEWVQQITVEFGLELIQILDLNEMDQVLTTSVRTLYRWTDYHLIWDPMEYENITFVNIPPSMVWLPDVALYNYADERLEERRESHVKVFSDGTVLWHPMAIYRSTCAVHIRHFPMDMQACRLKFGPWSFDGYRVNITFYDNIKSLSMDSYEESPEWKILGSEAVFTQITYPCCPEPYPDISFYVWIVRRPAFYNYILILPCFLLSSLTLVLFWLPPETPAKMVLGMNIFVAFFLLLLLLEDTIPSASSSFPLLGTYYCLNMGIITLSSFLSCIIVNFHFRGDSRQEVPSWLKKVVIKYGSQVLWVNVGNLSELLDNSKGLQLMTSDVRRMQATSLVSSQRKCTPNPFAGSTVKSSPRPGYVGEGSSAARLGGAGSSALTLNEMSSGLRRNNSSQLEVNPGSKSQPPESLPVTASQSQTQTKPVNGKWTNSSAERESSTDPVVDTPITPGGAYPMFSQRSSRAPLLSTQTSTTVLTPMSPQAAGGGPWEVGGEAEDVVLIKEETINYGTEDASESKTTTPLHRVNNHSTRLPLLTISKTVDTSEEKSTLLLDLAETSSIVLADTPIDERIIREQQRLDRLCGDVNDIMKGLRYLQRIHENKERLHRIFVEWRAVGMVLDRFFFFCYFLIIVLSILFLFTQSNDEVQVGNHTTVQG